MIFIRYALRLVSGNEPGLWSNHVPTKVRYNRQSERFATTCYYSPALHLWQLDRCQS